MMLPTQVAPCSLRSARGCSPRTGQAFAQDEQFQSSTRRMRCLSVVTWNVWSAVESSGPIEIGAVSGRVVEGKKIERIVGEMDRLGLDLVALQETHWSGNNSYRVGTATALSSGRPVPSQGDGCRRGEGVAVVLNSNSTNSWRVAVAFGPRTTLVSFPFD